MPSEDINDAICAAIQTLTDAGEMDLAEGGIPTAKIVGETDLPRRTVTEHVDQLVEAGRLERVWGLKPGGRPRHSYQLPTPELRADGGLTLSDLEFDYERTPHASVPDAVILEAIEALEDADITNARGAPRSEDVAELTGLAFTTAKRRLRELCYAGELERVIRIETRAHGKQRSDYRRIKPEVAQCD